MSTGPPAESMTQLSAVAGAGNLSLATSAFCTVQVPK
jgi:hypothetical protein